MTKRILSVVLTLALLLSAVSVAGITTSVAAEEASTVLCTLQTVGANMPSADNNILKNAVSANGYLHNKSRIAEYNVGGGNMVPASQQMMSVLVDGQMHGDNDKKLTAGQDGKYDYFYFLYDLGGEYDVSSVFYGGDTYDGANSVAVYVGTANFDTVYAVANAEGADKFAGATAYYDGGIGFSQRVTNNPTTDVAAIRFNFAEAITARYVLFRLEGCVNGADMVWISEFGAEGTRSNAQTVLYKKDQAAAATPSKADNLLKDAVYTGTSLNNPTYVVDGEFSASNKSVTSSGNTADIGAAIPVWFQYDLGAVHDIDKVFYAGDGTDGAAGISVYVGNDDLATLKAGGVKPTAVYESAIAANKSPFTNNNKTDSVAVAFTFDEAVSGRYVTFCLLSCTNAGTNAAGNPFSYEQNWISEFSATGKMQSGQVKKTLYKKLEDANNSIATANILADAENSAYRQGAAGGDGLDANMTKIVDGKAEKANKFCPSGNQYMYFWYDLGWQYDITSLMYAGDGTDGGMSVAVYVGDDDLNTLRTKGEQDTAFESIVYNDSSISNKSQFVPDEQEAGVTAVRFTFAEPKVGRYVIFRIEGYQNNGRYQCWITELAAAGTLRDNQTKTTLYTKKDLSDANSSITAPNVLADAERSAYRGSATGGDGTEASMSKIVDGKAENANKFCPNGPQYLYFWYDLGCDYDISTLLYAGDGTDGAMSVAAYVGNDSIDTLVAKGQQDTAFADVVYDDSSISVSGMVADELEAGVRAVRFTFSEPKTGRYVIFRIECYKNSGSGAYQCWITELAAAGTKVEADVYAAPYTGNYVPVAAADNVLTKADKAAYRMGYFGGDTADEKLLNTLADGALSSANSGKICPGGGVDTAKGENYFYVWYDLETAYEIDTLYFGGDTADGAKTVAVYVGNDNIDTLNAKGTISSAFEDIQYNDYVVKSEYFIKPNNRVTGVRFTLNQPKVGRYVIFRVEGYQNSGKYQCWVSELAAVGTPVTIHTAGAQLRDTEVTDNYALRFGFHMATASIGYAAEDSYVREELTADSKVVIDGKEVAVVDFGAVVSAAEDTAADALTLELAQAEDAACKKVAAVNLYAVKDGYITYTAVVTDIPAKYAERAIYARPYITYVDGDNTVTVYGDMFTACAADYIA